MKNIILFISVVILTSCANEVNTNYLERKASDIYGSETLYHIENLQVSSIIINDKVIKVYKWDFTIDNINQTRYIAQDQSGRTRVFKTLPKLERKLNEFPIIFWNHPILIILLYLGIIILSFLIIMFIWSLFVCC